MSDEMQNETSSGVQTRRYRLVKIADHDIDNPGPSSESSQLAKLELVQEGDRLVRFKWIDSNFLPTTAKERFAFMEDIGAIFRSDHRSIGEEIAEVIEFEITVKRVQPTPGYRSQWFEPAGAAP